MRLRIIQFGIDGGIDFRTDIAFPLADIGADHQRIDNDRGSILNFLDIGWRGFAQNYAGQIDCRVSDILTRYTRPTAAGAGRCPLRHRF